MPEQTKAAIDPLRRVLMAEPVAAQDAPKSLKDAPGEAITAKTPLGEPATIIESDAFIEKHGLSEATKTKKPPENDQISNQNLQRLAKAGPDEIVESVFRKDDPALINRLRVSATQEAFASARQAFLASVIGGIDNFSPQELNRALRQFKPASLMAIFGSRETLEIMKIGRLASRVDIAGKLASNFKPRAVDALSPADMSRLYLDAKGRSLLLRAIEVSAASPAGRHTTKQVEEHLAKWDLTTS